MKTRLATGPDGISSRLLRDCADQLYEAITYIFNLSLCLERVPILWKTSCVVPKTTHSKEPNHFRPVALTSHLMKTMERIILHHLRPLVGRDLDPLMFAYQPNIIYLLHWAFSHLESTRCTVRVLFFYFSHAFNTIQPSVLRGKLQWVRPQHVRLQDCVSEVVVCSTGPTRNSTRPFPLHPVRCRFQL